MTGDVLVFEAHSDDAAIGMGGTIKHLSDRGVDVTVCTVTRGETASGDRSEGETISIRIEEGKRADEIMGVKKHLFWGVPCQGVTNDKSTFHAFVKLIREIRPGWIFTHGPHEWHRDHKTISALTDEAWWKASERNVLPILGEPFRARALHYYEVLPMFPWNPDTCLDVSSCWNAKKEAVACFTSQAETMGGFDGLVDGKGMYRGFLIGAARAEAFTSSRFMPRGGF